MSFPFICQALGLYGIRNCNTRANCKLKHCVPATLKGCLFVQAELWQVEPSSNTGGHGCIALASLQLKHQNLYVV